MNQMSFKDCLRIQRKYFSEDSKEIAVRNLQLMQTVCSCGIALFLLYYGVTYLFFRDKMMSPYYGLFVPVLFVFLLRIKQDLKNLNITFRKTWLMTLLMYIVMMSYTLIMSVFAHPELNAVYFPLFLVLSPVILILPLYQQCIVNIVSYAVFFFCVVQVKAQGLWMHDLFEAFTGLMFSFISILLMTQFRVQSDSLKSKYYSMSRYDGLTGVLNKTVGGEMIRDYIENQLSREPFALILLDVDDFKNVNDSFGHEAGDEVLKSFGQTLSETFRRDDVVSRYGGDEFLVLMKNIPRQVCEAKLRTLMDQVGKIETVEGLHITASAGVSTGICGLDKLEDALRDADNALYAMKQHGKHNFRFSTVD